MSFLVDDEVEVTSDRAPYFGKRGVVEEVDAGFRVLPLFGVRFPGQVHLRWYTELELGKVDADAPTEQIPAVTG